MLPVTTKQRPAFPKRPRFRQRLEADDDLQQLGGDRFAPLLPSATSDAAKRREGGPWFMEGGRGRMFPCRRREPPLLA